MVILLHGIDDTSAFLSRLHRFLEEQGCHPHSLDLVPSNGDAGIERLAEQVAAYVDATFHADETVDLVGFSMGGIVARYYVQRLGGLSRVRRLITLGSPHGGTWTAFCRWNRGARQMRPGSDFLRDLDRDKHTLAKVRFTSIWTPYDLMILPAKSSVVDCGRSVRVGVLAHALIPQDRRVMKLVAQALLED